MNCSKIFGLALILSALMLQSCNTQQDYTSEARVALSYSSSEAAIVNLEKEGRSSSAWVKELSRIEFEGITAQTDTIFYTSLYHTAFAPQLFSDCEENDKFTIFSL